MKTIVCLLVALAVTAKAARTKISDFVTPCHADDPEINQCVKLAVLKVIPKMVKGVQELDLIPFDPLEVIELVMDLRENGPVGLKLTFSNSKHTGVSQLNSLHVRVVPERMYFEFNTTLPLYTIAGDYEVTGRILLLPITGSGTSNFTLNDLNLSYVFFGKPETRNNKVYARLTDCKLHITAYGSGSMRLNNLFNGNNMLGENMNRILNENFSDVIREVLPALEEVFSALFLRIAGPVIASIPYSEVFPGVNLTAVRAGDFNV